MSGTSKTGHPNGGSGKLDGSQIGRLYLSPARTVARKLPFRAGWKGVTDERAATTKFPYASNMVPDLAGAGVDGRDRLAGGVERSEREVPGPPRLYRSKFPLGTRDGARALDRCHEGFNAGPISI